MAGHKNQDQPILKVNILENPDILDWLTAGELLLTTGYIFKDDRKLQKNFLKELAKHHCAALGFKTQRYFEEVPPDLIKLANENCYFPFLRFDKFYYAMRFLAHSCQIVLT